METYKPAGFWIRVLAKFIDGIITSALAWIIAVLIGDQGYFDSISFVRDSAEMNMTSPSDTIANLIYAIVFIVIFTASRFRGTPGKMICRIQVLNPDMTQISILKSIGRLFAYIVSAIPLMVGYMMAGWNKEKKALHDMIAGTRVVYKRKELDKEEIEIYE